MKVEIEKIGNEASLTYWRTNENGNPYHTNTSINKLTESELINLSLMLDAMSKKIMEKLSNWA